MQINKFPQNCEAMTLYSQAGHKCSVENSGTEQGLPHGDLFRKVEYLPLTQIENTAFDFCDSHRTYIANGLFNLVSPFHILLLGSY